MLNFPVDFGEYLPDLPKHNNPGLTEAKNTYPTGTGYGPYSTTVDTGDDITQVARGSDLFFRDNEEAITCVGGDTILAVRTESAVTETTGYTSLGAEARWRFVRFGDMVIAAAAGNAPQYLTDLNTDTSFSALPGSPPQAEIIGRVDDFLVLGNVTSHPSRVQWSNYNDPTGTWDTNLGDLSGYFNLDSSYGAVTGIVRTGGRSGVVFQERAIWRMTFVGAPLAFDFTEISLERGCIAPDSIVSVGQRVFFLSYDGFFETDGVSVSPIGANRVDRTFFDDANNSYLGLVTGAMNWAKGCVVWAYTTGDNALNYSRQLIYSLKTNRWARAEISTHSLVAAKQDNLTLGDLDALYGTIGAITLPIGTEQWKSGNLLFGCWEDNGSSASQLALFTGAALEAEFDTGLMQLAPGSRTTITGIAPLIENQDSNTTARAVMQSSLTGGGTSNSATTEGADGFCPQNVDGLYAKLSMIVPAGATWNNASGLIARGRRSGNR